MQRTSEEDTVQSAAQLRALASEFAFRPPSQDFAHPRPQVTNRPPSPGFVQFVSQPRVNDPRTPIVTPKANRPSSHEVDTSINDRWLFPGDRASPTGLRRKLEEQTQARTSYEMIDEMIHRADILSNRHQSKSTFIEDRAAQMHRWLAAHDLLDCSAALEQEDLSITALTLLSDSDLKAFGLPLGCRRRLLAAVSQMQGSPNSPPSPQDSKSKAERSLKLEQAVRQRSPERQHPARTPAVHASRPPVSTTTPNNDKDTPSTYKKGGRGAVVPRSQLFNTGKGMQSGKGKFSPNVYGAIPSTHQKCGKGVKVAADTPSKVNASPCKVTR